MILYVALLRVFNLTNTCDFSRSQVALESHRGPLGMLCQIDILAQRPGTYGGDGEVLRRWSDCVFCGGLRGIVTRVSANVMLLR